MKWAFGLVAAAALTACSPVDTSKAAAAVIEFHRLQAAGDDSGIYTSASQRLRDAARLEDLQRIDNAARAAEEHCEPAPTTATSWRSYVGTGGSQLTLTYERNCSTGNLVETFVFLMDGGEPKLLAYNVSGMALFPAAPAPNVTTVKPPATPQAPQPPPSAPGTPT